MRTKREREEEGKAGKRAGSGSPLPGTRLRLVHWSGWYMVDSEAESDPVVELQQAGKLYQENGNAVAAVRDVDLRVEAGSFLVLVGRSGCGKSTLLNLAGAVDLPTSGEVRIQSRSTRGLTDEELSRLRREKIGFVFQFFHLLPTLTVAENIALPLLLGDRGSAQQQSVQVESMMERVGLRKKGARFPHQLSGGEMQRVAIARALVHQPALLIADEPTGNLDSANAAAILRLLQSACRDMGQSILMATHSTEAAAGADRVMKMKDGRLLD